MRVHDVAGNIWQALGSGARRDVGGSGGSAAGTAWQILPAKSSCTLRTLVS